MSAVHVIWITNPENYDGARRPEVRPLGNQRIEMLAEAGITVRVVHVCDVIAASSVRPHLWYGEEDLLDPPRGFMLSAWPWDAATKQHFDAVSRSIRASGSVLLNDVAADPERLGLDKLAMSQHVAALGIPVLPAIGVPFGRYSRRALDAVARWPGTGSYVVKPREMATGFGVVKADGPAHLRACLDLTTAGSLGCMVQPYYPNVGDLRVYVHQDSVVAGMRRTPAPSEYLSNLTLGGTASAVEVPPEIAEPSVRLASSLGADYLAVDWLVGHEPGQYVFNECMTVAASMESLPEPERKRVVSALARSIKHRLRAVRAIPSAGTAR